MDSSATLRTPPARLARNAILLVWGLATLLPSALATDEAALQRLWEQHLASPKEHAVMVKACQNYLAANPGDELAPMIHCIAAWHFLGAGKIKEAEQLLRPYLSAKPGAANTGANMVARGWMTRLDREKVKDSLQAYYRKEVGYPKDLAEIAAHPQIPESAHPIPTDRFGKPWEYRLTGFQKIEGFANQRYSLQSSVLGGESDLEKALETTYGSGIDSAPQGVMDRAGQEPLVKIKIPGGSGVAMIPAGQKAGDLLLAYVGEKFIVLCNHSYWKLFPRP